MTQRRSTRAGRPVVNNRRSEAKRERRSGAQGRSFKARVLLRGDTMKEVRESNIRHGVAVEGRTIGADPWTTIVYLDELHTGDPLLWVRPVGQRNALLRVSVWSREGELECRFVHRLSRGSVISLTELVQLGGVVLRSGNRVELFRLENSGPIQVVAQDVPPVGRLE